MQKGFGITAIVLAVISIFIPVIGPWLTIVTAALAAFAFGEGFALGFSAIIINLVNIFFLSPTVWLSAGLAAAASAQGMSITSMGSILGIAQVVALGILIALHMKRGKSGRLATVTR